MPDVLHPRDLALARRACRGQAGAWDEIISLYGRRIYNLALHFCHDRMLAEDLTQDVFLRLHRALDRYRGDTPLAAWTLRLSRNLCIDHYRRTRRERQATFFSTAYLDLLSSDSDPRGDLRQRELRERIGVALRAMSEDLATAVFLRDLQELSYDEIAALLDLPLGTVKSRINRGRIELRRRLEDSGHAPASGRERRLGEVAAC
jgi:RNA polymerase sigma-70 factor (ECF subfamily)